MRLTPWFHRRGARRIRLRSAAHRGDGIGLHVVALRLIEDLQYPGREAAFGSVYSPISGPVVAERQGIDDELGNADAVIHVLARVILGGCSVHTFVMYRM